ncbi:MAG: hypothetical protein ETSY2_25345 [Candidatus Entotheonella gemina]|uniref:ParB-like N-terminal domain-containing protein n=1 Tax=Candidatus Entotheonella gemina TaxID=1429439 RepID=W4M4B5_9BACT|nr:MAG: hypothetical protein ETSY2_25345 [Candidatus Entotheonella gemina]
MLETVLLDDIRTDGGTQPREYLNELVLSEYAESMTGGTAFPPVVIFFDGSHYWLADGFHRLFAAKKCGARDIAADVRQGTRREARLYAVGANATHGLRRTNADKRRAALTLLQDEEWQRWSNREIARQCGVTHTFVAKLRRELLDEPSPAATDTPAAPTQLTSATGPRQPSAVDLPDTERTGTSDTFFDAPASRQRDDLFDQLAPSEPVSTMDRLALEHREFQDEAPVAEPLTAPWAHVPARMPATPLAPDAGATPEHEAMRTSETKVTIEAMASSSQQGPAEWVTEMMVYWLLDLAAQYEGMTPDLVRQAAGKLGEQYEQACREIAPSA